MTAQSADPIVSVEAIELSIPFEDGGEGVGLTPQRWRSLEQVLVRIETQSGRVGWGDAFAYACRKPVAAAVREMVAPLLIGRDPGDPAALNDELQRKLHLFGRYGITIFAISGADIALWDLKAQAAGLPLSALIGGARRNRIDCYASLVRYGDAALVERYAREAVAEGYRSVKLHEIEASCIAAGRRGAGAGTHLTVDVNCVWSSERATAMLPLLLEQGVDWLEEPIFPPEDHRALASLRGKGARIAAGENACTSIAFRHMLEAGAVDVVQPSVTKVGGVTEFMRVAALAATRGRAGDAALALFRAGILGDSALRRCACARAPVRDPGGGRPRRIVDSTDRDPSKAG